MVFATLGAEEKPYADLLLSDDKSIVEVMEFGGVCENKFGQAIFTYEAIQKTSKNAREKEFFRLWALASALKPADGNCVPERKTAPEAITEYFLSY